MREAYALYGYNEAMKAGEKHDEAVRQAASHVRENLPGIPCSGTEVRRILARWRPRNSPFGWVVRLPVEVLPTSTQPGLVFSLF